MVWLVPPQTPTENKLVAQLLPDSWLKTLLPDRFAPGPAGWDIARQPQLMVEGLTKRCRDKPLVVVLDEAHTLDPFLYLSK